MNLIGSNSYLCFFHPTSLLSPDCHVMSNSHGVSVLGAPTTHLTLQRTSCLEEGCFSGEAGGGWRIFSLSAPSWRNGWMNTYHLLTLLRYLPMSNQSPSCDVRLFQYLIGWSLGSLPYSWVPRNGDEAKRLFHFRVYVCARPRIVRGSEVGQLPSQKLRPCVCVCARWSGFQIKASVADSPSINR